MKRSEMLHHIQEELKDMLESIENRPAARRSAPKRVAANILDMIEGFGMKPPNIKYCEIEKDGVTRIFPMIEWEPELTADEWQEMKENAKISPEDREKLGKLKGTGDEKE